MHHSSTTVNMRSLLTLLGVSSKLFQALGQPIVGDDMMAIDIIGHDLISLTPDTVLDTQDTCQGPEVVTCDVARINWSVVKNRENIILPDGDMLMFRFMLQSVQSQTGNRSLEMSHNDISLVYENSDGKEAVLTYTPETNAIYGTFEAGDKMFTLETIKSSPNHVVWSEIDQSQFEDVEPKMEAEDTMEVDIMRTETMERELMRGAEDKTSVAEYTITVHYTREFKEVTADPLTFIDQVIAETNQGYVNSGVPIRVKLHCAVESDIADGEPAEVTLQKFKQSQSSLKQVRRSADSSILLVKSFSSRGVCGVNYFNTLASGNTIGTVRKGCALGYYSFGHEVAHGFGLAHDRRVASSSSTGHAYGYVFRPGQYRTIMAYSQRGEKRVNYYSSPGARYKGDLTGDRNNDNARTLTDIRFAAASVGDESLSCPVVGGAECEDRYTNCPAVAASSCWHATVKEACMASCGLCPGMTPALSNTCYNRYSNCKQLAELGFCHNSKVRNGCKADCDAC